MFATIIGVFLGGWIALWVNRWSQRKVAEDEKENAEKELRRRRIQALQAARDAISNNANRIKNTVTLLKSEEIAYFNVDPKELDYLIPELLKTDVDLKLFHEINAYRYELVHVAREIDTRYENIYRVPSITPGRMANIKKSIIERGDFLIPKAEKIEKAIEGELTKESEEAWKGNKKK
jgi:hypothetical protein